MVLERSLESPLDCKEIQSVRPKGDQPCIFLGRMMLKLNLQYFLFQYLIGKEDSLENPAAGED